jgi:hypothetical protein
MMDYETLAANLRRLVAEGADAAEINKAAHAVASAESSRDFQAVEKLREDERQSGRQRILQEGDRIKGQWCYLGLGDHLECGHFASWADIADEACRIGDIQAKSAMYCLVRAVAEAASKVGNEDYD